MRCSWDSEIVALLMAYLSLEFVSLTSYVLTGTIRRDRRSGEAALKYLIYGGVASGTMIYGMSWIFGLTGTMDYAGINAALTAGPEGSTALFVAVVLIAPYLVQQFQPRENPVWMASEKIKQVELPGGELQRLAIQRHAA